MDLHDQVPVRIFDVLEADIPQDTGVVDEHVDSAKSLDRGVNDLVALLDRVVVCDSITTRSLDFLYDNIGSLGESGNRRDWRLCSQDLPCLMRLRP